MELEYYPEVVQAIPGPNKSVYAYFSDGTVHHYKVLPLLEQGGVFAPLTDDEFFSHALTVMNGTIAWDLSGCFDPANCIDIDPFVVYAAPSVEDPLDSVA